MVLKKGLVWEYHYPWGKLKNENKSDLIRSAKTKNTKYLSIVNKVVEWASNKGYEIWHHPFSLSDYLYAKTVLGNKNIRQLRFTNSINKNIRRFDNYSLFFATRLHSHIFSIMREIPIISFAYARKCISLLKDLDVEGSENQFSRFDLERRLKGGVEINSSIINTNGVHKRAEETLRSRLSNFEL
jgi:polysaccharide pyruvyl transferase WcaK-like protein